MHNVDGPSLGGLNPCGVNPFLLCAVELRNGPDYPPVVLIQFTFRRGEKLTFSEIKGFIFRKLPLQVNTRDTISMDFSTFLT